MSKMEVAAEAEDVTEVHHDTTDCPSTIATEIIAELEKYSKLTGQQMADVAWSPNLLLKTPSASGTKKPSTMPWTATSPRESKD